MEELLAEKKWRLPRQTIKPSNIPHQLLNFQLYSIIFYLIIILWVPGIAAHNYVLSEVDHNNNT